MELEISLKAATDEIVALKRKIVELEATIRAITDENEQAEREIADLQKQRKQQVEEMIALNKQLAGTINPSLFTSLFYLPHTHTFISSYLFPLLTFTIQPLDLIEWFDIHTTTIITSDTKSSLKAVTEEFEQAETTIESLTLQARKDADDMALLRKRVTELEAQNKTEMMKYQGAPSSLSCIQSHLCFPSLITPPISPSILPSIHLSKSELLSATNAAKVAFEKEIDDLRIQSKKDSEALTLFRKRVAELEGVKAALEKKTNDLMEQGTYISWHPSTRRRKYTHCLTTQLQYTSNSLIIAYPAAKDTEEIARLKQALAMLTAAKQTGKSPGLPIYVSHVIHDPY